MGRAFDRTPALMEKFVGWWKWHHEDVLDVDWGPRYQPQLLTIGGRHVPLQTLRAWVARDWLWQVTDALPNGQKPTRPTAVGLTPTGRKILAEHR